MTKMEGFKDCGEVIDRSCLNFDDLGHLAEGSYTNWDEMTMCGQVKSELLQEYYEKHNINRPRIYMDEPPMSREYELYRHERAETPAYEYKHTIT